MLRKQKEKARKRSRIQGEENHCEDRERDCRD
jgi:hypothetical protein